MSCLTHCCVLTRGEFFLKDLSIPEDLCGIVCEDPNRPYKKLGNVSSCVVEILGSVIGRENEFNIADPKSRQEILGVNLSITLNCASYRNLAQALFSGKDISESGSHSEEFCIGSLSDCDMFNFSKLKAINESVVVTLKNGRGDEIKTLEVDVDYKVTQSGVEIISDSIDSLGATSLVLSYDYDNEGFHGIDFLSKFQGYKSLYFKGVNYDKSDGALFDAIFHRVLFAPVNQFDLITRDEFLTLNLVGVVERKNGDWFKITKQE